MKYASLGELQSRADVRPAAPRTLSHRERLLRWAEVLETDPHRVLKPLSRIEFYAERQRDLLRRDDSPLALAYADEVLRNDGLGSDRLGDARRYFGLSEGDTHDLVCDCRYGPSMSAGQVARRLRARADPNPLRRLWSRLRD